MSNLIIIMLHPDIYIIESVVHVIAGILRVKLRLNMIKKKKLKGKKKNKLSDLGGRR